jgi:hypothetical protein
VKPIPGDCAFSLGHPDILWYPAQARFAACSTEVRRAPARLSSTRLPLPPATSGGGGDPLMLNQWVGPRIPPRRTSVVWNTNKPEPGACGQQLSTVAEFCSRCREEIESSETLCAARPSRSAR